MRRIIQHSCFVVSMTIAAYVSAIAQDLDYTATKEKIYIQTSHVFFKQGESVFFKVYVLNAKDQRPTKISNTVYVDVVNPAGNVLQKLKYKVEDGYAQGSFDFDEAAVGGIYKLRAYTNWMRNENESAFFLKEITLQKTIAPRVLMKLDFPEKGYGAGSGVSADFSMRNLSDEPIRYYNCRFTVSIAGRIIQTDNIRTNAEGKGKIKFNLPAELKSNDGLLNVTVDYDSYTEAISRSIPIVLNNIDLQFMPESGTLLSGINTIVAFKALNENGKAADIKGEIWDSKGNKITSFESYHMGMGKFAFTPQKGEKYKAKIIAPANIGQQFDLPSAREEGVIMNFSRSNNVIHARLVTNEERLVRLVGQTKNQRYYTKDLLLVRGENNLEIDERLFPAGIAQFTLLGAAGLPLAERLLFLNEYRNLQVSITFDKKKYLPREKVALTIRTLDDNGEPVPSNLSLAVMDDKLWSFADDKQDHILSWLLMSSELQGKIEEPQFYFKKDEPKAVPALDLVMLTHGYRYFDYIEYVQKEGRLKFTPDQDNILSGVVSDSKGNPVQAMIFLANTSAGGKGMQINTNKDGSFFFSHIEPNTNYYVIAQSLNKTKNISIKILQNGTGYNPQGFLQLKRLMPAADDVGFFGRPNGQEWKPVALAQLVTPPQMNFNAQAHLEEVVVMAYGAQRRKDVTGAIALLSGKELQDLNNAGFALQGRVAGLLVIPAANPILDPKIRIRGIRSISGMNEPLFVINGIPVEKPDLNTISPNDIESITVLKDAAATSLYGSRAANGAILIDSKKFRREKIRFNLTQNYPYASQLVTSNATVFTVARRFYAPKYMSLEPKERDDFRETIYWNPIVQTDKEGKAVVEFYNSDASTTFRAIAEGIGSNGKAGRAEITYAAQNAMSVDAKIPPYLAVGDKALLPLVIKNNKDDDIEISIEVNATDGFKTGDYQNHIVLKADSSQRILVPVQALTAASGNIRFSVKSRFGKETVVLPITAADKGFPVIETFSGNKNQEHHFTISKLVPGTLRTSLKLYKDLEGQLLDGIESMLREPHGCFEQTSSTTYPNIFVLKYLRESGKSNPQIEQKALDYIQHGYKMLIGFETSDNGFEWFGRTPPHEALTAYGLLEFTDMKEFVKVDEKMLARTRNFLLGRRDGKGTFKLVSNGLDQFSSVPDKIANIYIVYALTQAGMGKDIELEYQTAVKQALASKDGYQLAMMALAASNMKNEKDYRQLMNMLNDLFQKNDLKAETTVVNSRDASLRVETLSLYTLALMRDPSPNFATISGLISKILAGKCYYGYGSTQATVLALNAIVEYSKLTSKVSKDSHVDFVLNSKSVKTNEEMLQGLQEGTNDFAVSYSDKDNTIPYGLEVAYNTLTPPNSDKAELRLSTRLNTRNTQVGETVRMEIEVTNQKAELQPMTIAKIGIPAGLSVQPWQLKEIMEKNQVAYYEIFDNYLVFYWMGFARNETKKLSLDLKADIAGSYKAKASTVYLYYTPEYKNWNEGEEIEIK